MENKIEQIKEKIEDAIESGVEKTKLDKIVEKAEIEGFKKAEKKMIEKEREKEIEEAEKKEKEEKKNVENLLNCIYQNIQTAIQSIEELLKVCNDEKFCEELKRERTEYVELKTKLLEYAFSINLKPDDNSFMEKARLWTSIKMTTMMDKSARHLAEMMLLGTVMGTTTCYKDLYDHKNVDEKLYRMLIDLMKIEESNFDILKKFLKEM